MLGILGRLAGPAWRLLKAGGKRLRDALRKSKKKNSKGSTKSCPNVNPYCGKTRREVEKSKRQYEKLRDEHRQKLEDYKRDPLSHDNKGTYKNAPTDAARQKVYEGRIKALEKQIRKHEGELQKIDEALQFFGS